MKKTAVVLVPIYRNFLSDFEKISLQRCFEVFQDVPIVLVAPEGIELSAYQGFEKKYELVCFEKKYFETVKGYSKLLTRPFFYERFSEYTYMLIYQSDVFVFDNQLEYWCAQGYDYIGAPWLELTWQKELEQKWKIPFISHLFNRVGNGGFSLRNVETFIWVSKFFDFATSRMKLNEDIIWSSNPFAYTPLFRIPSFEKALYFGFEEQPEKCYDLTHQILPFGCHAWQKHNPAFWLPHFKRLGYDISFLLNP